MSLAIQAVLALIQQVLPLIAGGNATGLVGTIIKALTVWLPIIATEIETVYEPFKNIIAALNASGEVTEEQKAELKALDAKMDAAFDAAITGLDPDVDGS